MLFWLSLFSLWRGALLLRTLLEHFLSKKKSLILFKLISNDWFKICCLLLFCIFCFLFDVVLVFLIIWIWLFSFECVFSLFVVFCRVCSVFTFFCIVFWICFGMQWTVVLFDFLDSFWLFKDLFRFFSARMATFMSSPGRSNPVHCHLNLLGVS